MCAKLAEVRETLDHAGDQGASLEIALRSFVRHPLHLLGRPVRDAVHFGYGAANVGRGFFLVGPGAVEFRGDDCAVCDLHSPANMARPTSMLALSQYTATPRPRFLRKRPAGRRARAGLKVEDREEPVPPWRIGDRSGGEMAWA
jgi:hypothetical protein